MTLLALDGTPLVRVGAMLNAGQNGNWSGSNTQLDAAKEAAINYGHIVTDDGGTHTLDTSGSSSLQWRTGSVTFANGGTSVVVGLAQVDTANGPPGRAVNSTDTITFDVSKTLTGGGGGITANAWQSHVPDSGSLSVANGDLLAFCVQMVTRGGADSIIHTRSTTSASQGRPAATDFVAATYTADTGVPNCIIRFSDGHYGWFGGAAIFSSVAAQTWNSGSATKEYGNYLKFPFPVKIYGIYGVQPLAADCDLVLYSDPLGTPVAEKTVAIDSNVQSGTGTREQVALFASPYQATANQPLAAIYKPGGTNISVTYRSLNSADHQVADHCGTNGYAINRASGAFAAQNSSKDRFPIGLLLGAFDNGVGGRVALVNPASLVG